MRSVDEINVRDTTTDVDTFWESDPVEQKQAIDIVSAILRYRWAVMIPAFVGLLIGGVVYTQLPETYESAARLLVESDQPPILDSSGEVLKTVPGADVIQAQLFSDEVLMAAWDDDPRMQAPEVRRVIDEEFNGSFPLFAIQSVIFEPETEARVAANSLAFKLAIQHTSEELVNASSNALTESLIRYFDNRRKGSITEIRELLKSATDSYAPKLSKLESDHRDFQRQHPLEFDERGNAVNPHRTAILDLKIMRSKVESQFLTDQKDLAIIETTLAGTQDKRTALAIVGQYLDRKLATPSERQKTLGFGADDIDLTRLGFEEKLVPLMVELQKATALYGENHPSVKNLEEELNYSKNEFEKLSKELTDRIKALVDNTEQEELEAEEAGKTIVTALQAQVAGLKSQLQQIDAAVEFEKREASLLSQAEQQNASFLREIEQANDLFVALKEQMARINLSDKQAGIKLEQLNKPTLAVVVGPNLLALLAGGLGLGLMFGCGLAYLLESQAGTFRTAEEISASLKAPILTHIPFDSGRRSKSKKGDDDPYEKLDDKLSVLHRPSSMAAEAVRACRTAVFFEAASAGVKVIQVTSPLPSDGKTTMAGNLAVSIAQAGKRVIIVDCDLRRPQLSDNFALAESEGLTSVLNGDCDPDAAIHLTPIKNLSVMPSGPIPLNPAEALTLPEMGELLAWLRDRYDYVIVDTPPLLVVTDPSILASMVDGVVVTLKVRRKSKANAKEAVSILRGVGAKIMGLVINASDDTAGSDGYRGYGYYKYSRYASKYNSDSGYAGSRRTRGYASASNRPSVLVGGRQDTGNTAEVDGHLASNNGSVGLLTKDDDDDNGRDSS